MPIHACAACGSDRLTYPKPPATAYACPDCGWTGQPREFERYAEWMAHKDRLKAKAG